MEGGLLKEEIKKSYKKWDGLVAKLMEEIKQMMVVNS